MNNQKSYKIIVHSKKMRNICGASPAEVAKKVASKLLVKKIYSMYFSIVEIKTNKIIHYQSNKKELVRPYHKNGKLVKYRIIVKKMGKQVGGEYRLNLEDPNDPIFTFFPKEKYDISFFNGEKSTEDYYNKFIYIKDKNNNKCLKISFGVYIKINNKNYHKNYHYIELSKLNRCHFQGSTNLNALINYSKHLKKFLIPDLIYICLNDGSYIPSINISLMVLSILTTGQSWYNQFGFKSEDHKFDIDHNSRIIQMNIREFIDLISENIHMLKQNNENNENNKNNKNNEDINKITVFFEKYDKSKSKSVKEVFIEIKKQLINNEITEKDIDIINIIFSIILLSGIIIYNNHLKYIIPEE
jgi:hypothetical protein